MCPITHHGASLPFRPSILNSPLLLALSRLGGLLPLLLAANSAALNFKTGRGSPAPMGSLPLWAPDGSRRQPCRQGLPPMRPDGAVAKGPKAGGLDDEEDDDDNDVEEDDESSTDRWVSGSGTPGSFFLACRGSSGLWPPWFPLKGDLGRPLVFATASS
jgi:hypothetical protein